jgi:hypothetical protein
LADEVDGGDLGGPSHRLEPFGVPLLLQSRFQLGARSKWSAIASLPRPLTTSTSVSPARAASSTTYCTAGVSTTGNSSFGTALVAGRKRVLSPAAGMTALRGGRMVDISGD